jgi:hypothetical protein
MSIVAVAVFDKNCVVAMVEATEGRKHYAASRSPKGCLNFASRLI